MCGWLKIGEDGGADINGTNMANLCRVLSDRSDRDVIDKTGLTGMFDIHLDTRPVAPPTDASEPSDTAEARRLTAAAEAELVRAERFAQLQSALPQLGLKLVPARGSADLLVVDHVEKPSGN